jgi:phage tail sheath protein FI
MPEYLAPAVYVEEVDTGSKPIEGVSTSTAGMIGVTERGPVNVPILVTAFSEYQRWFGQYLDPAVFDSQRCYLPPAIEGFFNNGGKRTYVTRVLDPSTAAPATRTLVAPDTVTPASTQLLASAPAGATSIIAVDGTGFAQNDVIQIGTGTGAEFRTINAALTDASVLALRLPLSFEHVFPPPPAPPPPPPNVQLYDVSDNTTAGEKHDSTLQTAGAVGDKTLTLDPVTFSPPLLPGHLLRIGAANKDAEYITVDGVDGPPTQTVTLRSPLQLPHPKTSEVHRQSVQPHAPATTTQLVTSASPGDSVIVAANTTGLTAVGKFLFIDHSDPTRVEYRDVGGLTRLSLGQPAYADYPAGSRVELVTLGAASTCDLTADAAAGAAVVTVSNRSIMQIGDVIQIGVAPEADYAEIAALPAPLPGNNPGVVVLRSSLRFDHAAASGVVFRYAPPPVAFSTTLAVDASVGANSLIVSAAGPIAATSVIRVSPPGGTASYHVVNGAPAAVTARNIPLDLQLILPEPAGAPVVKRTPMIEVRALDAGEWGNRLQVGAEIQEQPLLTTKVRLKVSSTSMRLFSAAGVERGTELVITDAGNVEHAVKVQEIDRQNDYLITLESSTPLPAAIGVGDAVRSREYRFVVELLRQRDPANPLRNNTAIDREVFTGISLDPLHSRYFERVIGTTWDMTNSTVTDDDSGRALRKSDRRSEGESAYIRVRDLAPTTGLRAGPVAEYEKRPDGTQRLILLRLAHGDDGLSTLTDQTYIGADDVEPELRTGLFTLRNIEEISIVAAPGRTSPALQAALINHCELARYRFAVLDGQPPPDDTMANVQIQRQQFDTKYAALYHPWLVIPELYPLNPAMPADYPLPPSGHMLGIYARTDIERGVHKAPANEVVRGVTGLQRVLNKEQQDILNPYPVNINVIRDFRSYNRGIRVYGGRVITSDSDWKYVNVRRLLIFIEASIDRGLQWVVFEPNAEPLWARVRRSVSNFLTQIWRNGALEGTRVEEAYFVKCDRTTMTQTDIDQGRLICLVGVAPVKPAEFVIVRIGLWTAHADQ